MKNYSLLPLYRLAIVTLVLSSSALMSAVTQAQCCRHCRQRPNLPVLTVPMWEVYGINPWNPQAVPVSHFTPLQSNVGGGVCLGCQQIPAIEPGEVYLGEVSASDLPPGANVENGIVDLVDDQPAAEPIPQVEGEANVDDSPSDVILAPSQQEPPTPAGDKNPQRQDESAQQIEALSQELDKMNAELNAVITRSTDAQAESATAMKSAAIEIQKLADQTASLSSSNEKMMQQTKALENQLATMTDRLAAANKDRNSMRTRLKKNQEQRVSQSKQTKPNQSALANKLVRQLRKDAGEQGADKAGDSKAKKAQPKRANVAQQIKQLNASMSRQIKKSSQQIKARNKAAIAKLIEAGKLEDGPEVKKLQKQEAATLKANEAKIRKRVEDRIQRIKNPNPDKKSN